MAQLQVPLALETFVMSSQDAGHPGGLGAWIGSTATVPG